MNDTQLNDEIEALIIETAEAHHEAFLETDGADPDWPIWYAQYMHDRLTSLLEANFTISELVYMIVWAEKERGLKAPGADWASYYTRFLLERYL
jgi:NAD(P)H-hydrate epimerase